MYGAGLRVEFFVGSHLRSELAVGRSGEFFKSARRVQLLDPNQHPYSFHSIFCRIFWDRFCLYWLDGYGSHSAPLQNSSLLLYLTIFYYRRYVAFQHAVSLQRHISSSNLHSLYRLCIADYFGFPSFG